jgi:hypothetical protein
MSQFCERDLVLNAPAQFRSSNDAFWGGVEGKSHRDSQSCSWGVM